MKEASVILNRIELKELLLLQVSTIPARIFIRSAVTV
jgi:hypothetical protein